MRSLYSSAGSCPRGLAALAFAGSLLAGCSFIPDYERPAAPVPAAWPAGDAYPGTVSRVSEARPAVAEIGWRDFFADPGLRRLIALALENNRDLRVAALDIVRARAEHRITRSELFPKVDANAAFERARVGEDFTNSGSSETGSIYDVNLGFSSYELDFFGRVRSLEQQAVEDYLATEEARRSLQISLVAEVADAYLTLIADRERLALARQTVESQQASYELTRRSQALGIASALDLQQARISVERARADVALYRGLIAQDLNALALVVGAPLPPDLLEAASLDAVTLPADLPAGLPSDLLLRRPDILQAEHRLKGANANIGAARAAFYPRITLTASGGLGSVTLGDLFDAGGGVWTFAPKLSLPIFDAGENEANLKIAETDRAILVARYEQAIQTAFREVADALAVRGTVGDRLEAQQDLVGAADESYRLAEARFRRGVDSYLAVLDSQRELYSAQQDLITLRLSRIANLVTLYKVLGGGLKETTAATAPGTAGAG